MNNEWLTLSIDCMPKINQRFDAWVNGRREPDCGPYIGGGWDKQFQFDCMSIKGITHWMPLPEPPSTKMVPMQWIKATDRLPELPTPLPPDTPEERGILFVNRKHSATSFWFPSYGISPKESFAIYADRRIYDEGFELEHWEWLEETPSEAIADKYNASLIEQLKEELKAKHEEVKLITGHAEVGANLAMEWAGKAGDKQSEINKLSEELKQCKEALRFRCIA